MEKTYCDRCGIEILDVEHYRVHEMPFGTVLSIIDFCDECKANFRKWLRKDTIFLKEK